MAHFLANNHFRRLGTSMFVLNGLHESFKAQKGGGRVAGTGPFRCFNRPSFEGEPTPWWSPACTLTSSVLLCRLLTYVPPLYT
jgi:hypothetical protein